MDEDEECVQCGIMCVNCCSAPHTYCDDPCEPPGDKEKKLIKYIIFISLLFQLLQSKEILDGTHFIRKERMVKSASKKR